MNDDTYRAIVDRVLNRHQDIAEEVTMERLMAVTRRLIDTYEQEIKILNDTIATLTAGVDRMLGSRR